MSCMYFPGYNTGKSEWRGTYVVNRGITPLFQVVALKSLRTMENFKPSSLKLKVVAIAYERWLFTGGSNYKALTG